MLLRFVDQRVSKIGRIAASSFKILGIENGCFSGRSPSPQDRANESLQQPVSRARSRLSRRDWRHYARSDATRLVSYVTGSGVPIRY